MELIEVKSKFDADIRRFSLDASRAHDYNALYTQLERLHGLDCIPFVVQYIDPKDNALLPINNDLNFKYAVSQVLGSGGRGGRPLFPLKLWVQRKGESYGERAGYGIVGKGVRSGANDSYPQPLVNANARKRSINIMSDFRCVSSVIDVDLVPHTFRRVRLMYTGEKALGFHIRDGVSMRVTPNGVEKVPGIFISRLVPNGLAASTGLLAVNDEIVEINGIEVRDKSLDQVSDMMIANSANLIITVKPVNQSNSVQPRSTTASSGGSSRVSQDRSALSGGGVGMKPSPSWQGSMATDSAQWPADAHYSTPSSSKHRSEESEVISF